MSYNDLELQRQEAATCSGHLSETETFIKQARPLVLRCSTGSKSTFYPFWVFVFLFFNPPSHSRALFGVL